MWFAFCYVNKKACKPLHYKKKKKKRIEKYNRIIFKDFKDRFQGV